MKHKALFSSLLVLGLLAAVLFLSASQPMAGAQSSKPLAVHDPQDSFSVAANIPGVQFLHTATSSNIDGNATTIDHPRINDDPDAIIFITHNWNPGDYGNNYNNHPVGMKYNATTNRWMIINQDLATMREGTYFNVLIPDVDASVFVHTAAVPDGNKTYIDHPRINDDPDAVLLVTPNVNPSGAAAIFNNHTTGVFYDDTMAMWAILNEDLADLPTNAAFNVLIPDVDSSVFVHTANSANIANNYTYIDNPFINEKPKAMFFVTQNVNPGGGTGTYNDQNIGVWYSSSEKKWAIFNQDGDSNQMTEGTAFNVIIPVSESAAFVHTVTAGDNNATTINHALTNEDPYALLLVTQTWNDSGVGGAYNDHPVGVAYDEVNERWTIINEDQTNIPDSASFNVLVPAEDASVFLHTATTANTNDEKTYIDHPLANNNPSARLFVTQNWNPGGGAGVYNAHPVGVYYEATLQEPKWAIYNEDHADVPVGASFNVFITIANTAVFVHTAVTDNIEGNFTHLDHISTQANPDALLFVTQNRSPGGGMGADNSHPVGLYYSDSSQPANWAIINQDIAHTMPSGAAFNVYVIGGNKSTIYMPVIVR